MMPRAVPKLWNVTPHVAVGTSGRARLTDVMRCAAWPQLTGLSTVEVVNELARHFGPILRSEFELDGNSRRVWALIAVEEKIIEMSGDLSMIALDTAYWALGSGELVAMGALAAMHKLNPLMSARDRITCALETCAEHLSAIRPPWVFAETSIAK